jgi:hypothetical protein
MSAFPIPAGDVLTLRLQRCKEFRCGCPEIFEALIDSAAFVNWRRVEATGQSSLWLTADRSIRQGRLHVVPARKDVRGTADRCERDRVD